MTITVTEFKARCLKILRDVEVSGKPVDISKQGRVRFRIVPVYEPGVVPWKRLTGTGRLLATPGESVISTKDFVANQ